MSSTGDFDRCIGIIPARLGSTRFPGKVLADRTGKPLIRHVWEAACRCRLLSEVVIATDDRRVADAAAAFGARAVMTAASHPNGTSRLAEAATMLGLPDEQVVVNVQGDEPELEPEAVERAVGALAAVEATRGAVMGTVATRFRRDENPADPACVKVVVDQHGCAMYFSRAVIPLDRDGREGPDARPLRHIGVYVYRCGFLRKYAAMPQTSLERAEQLEQLRALQNGYRIAVGITSVGYQGIDTPEQYEAFVARHAAARRG